MTVEVQLLQLAERYKLQPLIQALREHAPTCQADQKEAEQLPTHPLPFRNTFSRFSSKVDFF